METKIKNNLKKPCPFCGRWINTELDHRETIIVAEGISMVEESEVCLVCDSCGMRYSIVYPPQVFGEDALKMFEEHWNSMKSMYEKVPVEDKKPDTSVFDALARVFAGPQEEEETLEEYIDGEIEYCLDQLSSIDDAWIHRHLGRIESLRHVKDWLEVYGEN